MAVDAAQLWSKWFEVFNARDWSAWDELIDPASTHITVEQPGSPLLTRDRDGLRAFQKGAADAGFTAVLHTLVVDGSALTSTFSFDGPRPLRVAGLVRYGEHGRMVDSYSIVL